MANERADLVVIGAGPGGEGAAMRAAKGGLDVVMIDKLPKMGGSCTHRGTIPSKSLRHSVGELLKFRANPLFEAAAAQVAPQMNELLAAASTVIDKQSRMRRAFYTRNGVRVICGHARFSKPQADGHVVVATEDDGSTASVIAPNVVVATGSRPWRPAELDFSHPCIRDSDTILELKATPRTITIFGAGVIGCEYASIFRNLGVKVNLVNSRDRLLSFLDDEISDALTYHLRDQGVTIRHNEEFEGAETAGSHVVLKLKSGKRIRSDVLLWAAGRTGNTDRLGVEAVGLVPNGRGQLDVDPRTFQTTASGIWAVGDVVGPPGLASASYDQGRFAAAHIADGNCEQELVEHIPTGIYTAPEISSVGATERELTAANVPYEVGHSFFRHLARAQITGNRTGMLKLLFHRETTALLGIHCFGDQAAEIVHIGQAIMAQQGSANTVRYFANTTFNYPTMAEAYRVAALNGLNRLC